MNYDIIGDIHGHADALRALLSDLGYRDRQGAWRHQDRQAIFVGDFIDRGPKQLETIDIVRRMVEAGTAKAIMGNHELNAIAWFLPDAQVPGDYLRSHHSPKHGEKNFKQHEAFLAEVIGTPRHKEIIDWFLTLPLWLELDEVRVVHACWHERFMDYLRSRLASGNRLTEDLMIDASREPEHEADKDTAEPTVFKAVEALTKGIEIPLPQPHSFKDKDGFERRRVRIRWWDPDARTYRRAAMLPDKQRASLPDHPIPEHVPLFSGEGKPLFIGHYWLTGEPRQLSDKVSCVDYSIAKGGRLVAYRWNGKSTLDQDCFRWVGRKV